MPESLTALVEGIRQGDTLMLARGITLIESEHPKHAHLAAKLLDALLPSKEAPRLGISGTPGVGKSTFLDRYGSYLTSRQERVAVLAIDPSSGLSGGSILGDKTRMRRLSNDPLAYIRPSPTSGTLGGVARKTRETVLLCEAAGFDRVIVETVGVGQNETAVSDLVDETLLLLQAGAGDGLQGIKRGILERADMVVVHKKDLNPIAAEQARSELRSALRLMRGKNVPVFAVSSESGDGLSELYDAIDDRFADRVQAHRIQRSEQSVRWMWRLVEDGLLRRARKRVDRNAMESKVRQGELKVRNAAESILTALFSDESGKEE